MINRKLTYQNFYLSKEVSLKKGVGVEKKCCRYTYDALNRITSAIDNTGHYNLTSVSYDKNGNIKTLDRKGDINTTATLFGNMDLLKYYYQPNSNKLKKVLDTSGKIQGFKDGANVATEYTYDQNGNMKTDANKGITSILYNHLNLPTEIKFNNSNTKKINYTYDAIGTKLRKVVNDNGSITTTDYAGNYVYENNQLQFFNTAEGYVTKSGSNFNYVYQYKDHLGNIRLSYSDSDGNGTISQSEIIEENNYYPMGLKHRGYNNNINGVEHKYKYNGKELQDELGLNWYDLGARNLDHALGRFMNIDPRAEDYNFQSPYTFAGNNPIYFIDINGEGLDDDYGVDQKGYITLIKKTNDKFDRLYSVTTDDNGEVIKDKNGEVVKNDTNGDGEVNTADSSGKINNRTILPTLSKNGPEIKLTGSGNGKGSLSSVTATSDSKNDLFKVFKFASDNSNVEFSLAKLDFGGTTLYNLSTYHNTEVSPGENGVLGGTLKGLLHSHPNIQTYLDKNGNINWGLSQLKSLGKDGNIVRRNQITYPYNIYFPQTKKTMGLKFNKNSYPNVESSNKKTFRF